MITDGTSNNSLKGVCKVVALIGGSKSMRRGVGIGGLQRQAATKDTFRNAGKALAATQIEQLNSQFQAFKALLEDFAKKHQKDIAKNPALRSHFQKMCASIGVDPLVSSKGFWAEILGVGDFYYELGIQIVESCLVLQEQTGGLVDLATIRARLRKTRGRNAVDISDDDIARAIGTLKPLGSGYKLINLGSKRAVQSVPLELSSDVSRLIAEAEGVGYLTMADGSRLGWTLDRYVRALDNLVREGLVWIDQPTEDAEIQYWFPCFFAGFAQ